MTSLDTAAIKAADQWFARLDLKSEPNAQRQIDSFRANREQISQRVWRITMTWLFLPALCVLIGIIFGYPWRGIGCAIVVIIPLSIMTWFVTMISKSVDIIEARLASRMR